MATFTTYGHTFDAGSPYAEGHIITANEATALNNLRAEFLSHRIRNGPFKELKSGDTPTPEQIAEAEAKLAEAGATFEFGAQRMPGSTVQHSPLEKVQYRLARQTVRDNIKEAGLKLAKKGEDAGEGEYPFEKYEEKVEEIVNHEAIVARAKTILKAETKESEVQVSL